MIFTLCYFLSDIFSLSQCHVFAVISLPFGIFPHPLSVISSFPSYYRLSAHTRSDEARVRIHVEDANDNAPAFVGEDQFLAHVKEEQDEGLLVTQLYAQVKAEKTEEQHEGLPVTQQYMLR